MTHVDQVGVPAARRMGAGGGVADKMGNKYELSWAVYHALLCIQDERRRITLEDLDPQLADGSEFTFVDEHGTIAVTQVKRQHSINDRWTIPALRSRGVFASAERHVASGREYRFRSTTPCAPLRSLSERARQSSTLEQFLTAHMTTELSRTFDELTAPDVLRSADVAWRTLRGMWFEIRDEHELVTTNMMLASTMLTGAVDSLLPGAIGGLLLDSLRQPVTRTELLEGLHRQGIEAANPNSRQTARDRVHTATESWRQSVERELLTPQIPRTEARELVELMQSTRLALVVGAGGGGKSSVVYQAAMLLEARGAQLLSFRLDRCGAFSSTDELGKQIGLSTSPVASLMAAANGRDAFLIIDQLDAISLASGRLSERYDVIADLIQEAMSVSGVRVILVCRLFDVENDHRIRKFDAREDVERLAVEPLPDQAVATSVTAMGLDPSNLTQAQRELLRSPLNLVLLETVAGQADALSFTSRGSLFEAFWQRKRQAIKSARPDIRFNEVLARVASAASDRQMLSIPVEILDAEDYAVDAQVLASEQVLSIDGGRVSFFHETFFDYTFARHWLFRDESLVDFLCAREQELFRRAQVRQILELLRERDPARFRAEVSEALTDGRIRSHIQETILMVFSTVDAPTVDDLNVVQSVADKNRVLGGRMWRHIARPSWFRVLNSQGLIGRNLDDPDPILRARGALWLCSAHPNDGAEVAALLSARRLSPEYAAWLIEAAQRTDLHLNRALFDLLLDAVRSGAVSPGNGSLWFSTQGLVANEPKWALELLRACFGQSPSSLSTGDGGKVGILASRDYGLLQLIEETSRSEPRAFAEAIVPYLMDVMRTTAFEGEVDRPILDRHYGYRFPSTHGPNNVSEALYEGAKNALEVWVCASPGEASPLLRTLANDSHDGAQALLFHTIAAGPAFFADWGARLILQGGGRLRAGYLSDGHWLSREVIAAIAPHVSDADHSLLEADLRDYRDPHEQGSSYGYTAFKFLSALDERRISPEGARRLGEYRRKFKMDEPPPAAGIISYSVGSPIGDTATKRMSDDHWLGAFARHDGEGRDADRSVGGARELSHVLKVRATEDPSRYSRLAMRMTRDVHPAYASAILWGFGEAEIPPDTQFAVFQAIRHLMNLGLPECDRWLGWSVRRLLDETPLDLIELITERALHAVSPEDDTPVFVRNDDKRPARDLRQNGINTARGSLAEALGDLLIHDAHGDRTAAVEAHLLDLVSDPVLSVRACVAHTIAACLRHARPAAYAAFERLIDADDTLLASEHVHALMMYIGNSNPEQVDPVIDRMLRSLDEEVRHFGGCMAAFAALQWGRTEFMSRALAGDPQTRSGAAVVCSARIDNAGNSKLLINSLRQLVQDQDEEVRKAAGQLVSHLRGSSLRPYAGILADLIGSESYAHAVPQLLIVLQEATDEIDDLVDLAAHRFLSLYDGEIADVRTGAAGDAHYISELVVRALAQSRDRQRVAALLDILDRLVELGAYGVDDAIEQAARR